MPQHSNLIRLKGSPARCQVRTRGIPNLGTIYEFVCNGEGDYNDNANVVLEEMLRRCVLSSLFFTIGSAKITQCVPV